MQAGVSKWPVWRRMVFPELPTVAALDTMLVEEAAGKKYHITLLILEKLLQQDLSHAKYMPAWVALETLQHSPLSDWFDRAVPTVAGIRVV